MTKSEIKELYALIDWSDVDFTKANHELADRVLSRLGSIPGKRILDLGCGSASLGVELAHRGFDVVGLDLQVAPARARAEARGVKLVLLEQDMSTMDFRQEFDAIINWDISGVGLLPSDEDNIDIIRRVYDALLPGGKFLVETYNLEYVQCNPGSVEGLVFHAETKRCVPTRPGSPSIRLFSRDEWQTIAERIGFVFSGAWANMSGSEFDASGKFLVLICTKPDMA